MKIEPQITVPCRVVKVIDGDTVDVELRTTIRVRLDDCWAPGKDTKDGKAATREVERLLPVGSRCLLQVCLKGARTMADILTFGRVLGRIYRQPYGDIGEHLVQNKLAAREKNDWSAD